MDYDEKPNLRPTKRREAGGKSVFLHHNPNQPSNKSYIHASWRDSKNREENKDPFGINQPEVEYSLNKRQRWQILHDFRRHIEGEPSSSSDEDRATHSDDERKRKKGSSRQQGRSTKYRLYELHNTDRQANCVGITTNVGARRVQLPKKTYMTPPEPNRNHGQRAAEPSERGAANVDVTYYAVVPPPREKQLANIRKHNSGKSKKATVGAQRSKFTQAKDQLTVSKEPDENETSTSTDDEEESSPKPTRFQLNDFIFQKSENSNQQTKIISKDSGSTKEDNPRSFVIYKDEAESMQYTHKYHRQISKEEKLYNRDMATFRKQKNPTEQTISTEKSLQHLMSLSSRSILVDRSNLTVDYLSKTYGKNFFHAQCYPTKYLICLTDRLKASKWTHKFDLFTKYVTLNSYLIILIGDDSSSKENYQRVDVSLNMDLFCETIQIENLYESTSAIYQISDVIDRTVEFITTIPFDLFKPIDTELSQKRIVRNDTDSELSDTEFINKQIRQLHLLDKKENPSTTVFEDLQTNSESDLDDYALIRPDICTNCYQDMDETTPMTALKTCAHWLCNNCWKQYLEGSSKRPKIIFCPEWNCESIVDMGTLLSLVNVRCMNIYQGNVERCLVNTSRSYVQCPLKSCSNINQVIGPCIDHVRCRCGHQFCFQCKQEPHFPASCSAYRIYISEVLRNGDHISDYNAITQVKGRNCVSCNNFIEKNGGCNHMTCRCGAEFCWSCTGYWKDHNAPDGTFRCPREAVPLQDQVLAKDRSHTKRYYCNAIHHRHERILLNQAKFRENAKRLLSTIPLEKDSTFNEQLIQKQIDKRESVLRHLNEMMKYIEYLHRICEYLAVSADGYGNNPSEFRNSLQIFEINVLSMSQIFEGGRGYQAIEQLTDLHNKCEKLIERLQRAVTLRELRRINTAGYATS